MKRYSAQYVLTNTGPLLKRGIITTDNDGTVLDIEDTSGDLKEQHCLEFYNGIIIPGFVNCHCHTELSHLKGKIPRSTGLSGFVMNVKNSGRTDEESIFNSIKSADDEMYSEGIVLCADICNTSRSFDMKTRSRIEYINLLEVFGNDPVNAEQRMEEITEVAGRASEMNLPSFIVPHSVYSMSLPLFRLVKERSTDNSVTSIHFMESEAEKLLISDQTGPLYNAFVQSGLIPPEPKYVKSHALAILNEITPAGNLILVHNTFADPETIREVKSRKNLFWCLCPNSNLYIENRVPQLNMFIEENCDIVIGTDSLASNNRLSIIDELKTLQLHFPASGIEDLIVMATLNGAKALGEADTYGTLEPGKKPGLLLLQNVDLMNMKLLPESFVTRLV